MPLEQHSQGSIYYHDEFVGSGSGSQPQNLFLSIDLKQCIFHGTDFLNLELKEVLQWKLTECDQYILFLYQHPESWLMIMESEQGKLAESNA